MEKTLSDYIVDKDVTGQDKKIGYIHANWVAEFIKKLKEEIDKLAGAQLINNCKEVKNDRTN